MIIKFHNTNLSRDSSVIEEFFIRYSSSVIEEFFIRYFSFLFSSYPVKEGRVCGRSLCVLGSSVTV